MVKRLMQAAEYVRVEAGSGVFLMAAAFLAMVAANSPLVGWYKGLTHAHVGPIDLHLLVNDGLMAIFFLVVGLEIKREIFEGELSSMKRALLPGLAAVGGMLVPALIYVAFNLGEGGYIRGWAVPTATDIAFSLGILSLFGNKVPISLKIFLTALAIIDDLLAVLAIAAFYTSQISWIHLGLAFLILGVLAFLAYRGVKSLWVFLLPGLPLLYLVYQSGVHATIAGVLLAMVIPLRSRNDDEDSPLVQLEHALHTPVAYGVLPIFAFFNSGVPVTGLRPADFQEPVTLGVLLGLFVGKQVGVFALCWALIKAKVAELPQHVSWGQFYGISALTGVGFTMSLFIGGLAYSDEHTKELAKVGVIGGSLLSALLAATLFYVFRDSEPD
ncbi:MAG: Na+/H+ antiporter NhaA [Armatimonadetes bacterium]|nr:Na+/H+ antiporter NhaA [Armatimonadota bacterium]MBS1711945.1 Na+/H+ antiporter NhaA [Armatimonadota bacterium]MBX3109501.1 Na+/H+ antiporter NhaA [Fimbriimonadaceae bacterium]